MADIKATRGAAAPPGRRQEVAFALAVLLSVIVMAALLETGFRALRAEVAATRVEWGALVKTAARKDPLSGHPRFLPGSVYGSIRFNSFGLRGPDVPTPAPPDTVRIAFLGDSKVMSANYPEDLSLPAQTIARLAARVPECRFDYLSISGPGYGVGFLARLWAEIAPQVQPDLAVVLAGTVTDLTRIDRAAPGSADPPGQDLIASVLGKSMLLRGVSRRLTELASKLSPTPAIVTRPLLLEQRQDWRWGIGPG